MTPGLAVGQPRGGRAAHWVRRGLLLLSLVVAASQRGWAQTDSSLAVETLPPTPAPAAGPLLVVVWHRALAPGARPGPGWAPANQATAAADNQPTDHQADAQPARRPQEGAGRVEQRRQVVRRFAVPAGGRALALDARYGRVQLTPWDRAEIRVEAELVGRAETAAGARQVLDALGVQFLAYDAHSNGGVAVASQFGPALRGGRGAGAGYEINYRVWLPRATALRLTAAFCDVTIGGELRGPTDLAVDYGTLRAGRLSGPRNRVRISNGACALTYARQASLDARFARLQLGEGRVVDLRNNYSDISIGTVGDLTIHSKYGDVALGQVQSLRGESGYSRFSVERLSQELDMDVQYSPDFEVRDFGPDFRQITLDGGFSTIRLGFAEAPVFQFEVRTEQGQLLVDSNLVRVLSQETGPRRSDVLGVFGLSEARRPGRPAPGAPGAAGKVRVKLRHGTVRFSR